MPCYHRIYISGPSWVSAVIPGSSNSQFNSSVVPWKIRFEKNSLTFFGRIFTHVSREKLTIENTIPLTVLMNQISGLMAPPIKSTYQHLNLAKLEVRGFQAWGAEDSAYPCWTGVAGTGWLITTHVVLSRSTQMIGDCAATHICGGENHATGTEMMEHFTSMERDAMVGTRAASSPSTLFKWRGRIHSELLAMIRNAL